MQNLMIVRNVSNGTCNHLIKQIGDESMKMLTKSELFKRYGYLMDQEHGKDTELLMDIMKCNGIDVECNNGKYFVLDT